MKEPARRRGRPRSEEAHQAILAAAIELVREVGYDAVAMDAIAARAGVGKATVYRRWKAKEPLVCEALEQIMRSIPVPDAGDARADLRALMREQRSLYADPATRGLLSGLVAAMARSKRIAAVVRGSFYKTRHDAMLEVLRRALRRGELRKDVDLEVALDLFNGPLFYRFLFTGGALDDAFADAVIDGFLEGLAPRGRGKRAVRRRRR
jgi:AcrR family transcriptional regulator